MATKSCSDDTFVETFQLYGAARSAGILKMSERSVHKRRRSLEMQMGRPINGPRDRAHNIIPGRLEFSVPNGYVVIGSDAHYWPGPPSTAHRAFIKFIEQLKPKMVIMNGDACDFATISRHPRIAWEVAPSVEQELAACTERLGEIEVAAKKAKLVWPAGNHDLRFESVISRQVPELAKVMGVHLKDHFPKWSPCWSAWINGNTVVKHRWRGGIYATRNNAVNSGKNIVTGHLHSLKVTPVTNYNGTLWGVDTGTLAEPFGPQFEYAEDNPRDWRSGFIVLKYKDFDLLQPEMVIVKDEDHVQFRGDIIEV